MLYLLQTVVYGMAFWLIYILLLRNSSTFVWNRVYLLSGISLSVLLPLISINSGSTTYVSDSVIVLPAIQVVRDMSTKAVAAQPQWFATAYGIVCIVLLAVLLLVYTINWLRLIKLPGRHLSGGEKLVTWPGHGPGSLGNIVFFPDGKEESAILTHELAHVRYRHSIDILFVRTLLCFYWFNPFMYFMLRELRMVHEFQADGKAADSPDYAGLLLNAVFHTRQFTIHHTFFHHPIKRRIIMLNKNRPARSGIRATIALSLATSLLAVSGVFYLQSCSRPEPKVVHNTTPAAEGADVPDVMPEPTVDLPTFLGENIVYPTDAKTDNIRGKVVIGFTVDKEGNVLSPEVVRVDVTSADSKDDAATPVSAEKSKAYGESFSAEAIRVVKLLPKWKPGTKDGTPVAAKYYLPFRFELN